MSREAILILTLVTLLFGGLSAWALVSRPMSGEPGPAPELLQVRARLAGLEGRLGDQSASLDQLRHELEGSLLRLEGQVDALSTRALDPPVGTGAAEHTPREGAPGDPLAEGESTDALRAEFATLLALDPLSDATLATADEQARFWELARTTGVLGELISRLEARLAEQPGDLAVRLELADAYVAKLLTVPAGPERGAWGMKAEQQWKDVLAADPDNWEAQFSLAENYSHYPEFLNKTNDAIAGLQHAVELQQGLPHEPEFPTTYLLLSQLHAKQGDAAAALQVLQQGLLAHPGDAALQAALATLDA